jgi:hypothetical protein
MSEALPSISREKSKSRSKKAAKSAKARKTEADDVVEAPVKPASPYPVFDLSEAPPSPPPAPEESMPAADWPEPEPSGGIDPAAPENPKRKRRRKKGKGGGQQTVSLAPFGEEASTAVTQDTAAAAPAPRHTTPPRTKLDAELIAKLAWKIYLAEVSEEGVALIGDNDAKELSRRCFRLAEIFTEEQAKRR